MVGTKVSGFVNQKKNTREKEKGGGQSAKKGKSYKRAGGPDDGHQNTSDMKVRRSERGTDRE